ncbi:hypothetical protein BDM02DRAFT_3154396 [Thelephora ganbajun]|uniref:Uncharacterized protein n=1 Tax=Thelephora ganbajun TaxID=370292 RepID=A0ACB6ZPP6_THEGA|nr:hypothetical protein BDM02DRAFT_3154396 [Thelephora ganbajun]
MLNQLSNAVALYLAPILSLTAVLLTLFSYLSPAVMLHTQVSLLVVKPSLLLLPSPSKDKVDGPSVLLGPLGSCSRTNSTASINCTVPVLNPHYDLSVLPNDTSRWLSAPTAATPAFIAIALGFSFIFFVLFTLIAFRAKLGARLGAALDRPTVQRASAWIGIFGFMIGVSSFLVIRLWFGKAVDDFNQTIELEGDNGPHLIAELSNGFTMVWVGYAFHSIPLVCALAKIHVTAAPPSKA